MTLTFFKSHVTFISLVLLAFHLTALKAEAMDGENAPKNNLKRKRVASRAEGEEKMNLKRAKSDALYQEYQAFLRLSGRGNTLLSAFTFDASRTGEQDKLIPHCNPQTLYHLGLKKEEQGVFDAIVQWVDY